MSSKLQNNSKKFTCNKHSWEVIKALFKQSNGNYLIRHQIDSYDDFINNKIPNIISQFNPVTICNKYDPELNKFKYEIHVVFGKIYLGKPKIFENNGSSKIMFPIDARKRNLSYSSSLYIDVSFIMKALDEKTLKMNDIYTKKFKKLIIGKIPIMLKSSFCMLNNRNIDLKLSKECRYDPGGYFIINGSEKVIISQERVAENKILVFKNNKGSTKYSHVAEIKASNSHKFITPKSVSIKLTSKESTHGRLLKIFIPNFKQEVPLFIIFRLLGVVSDKDIIEHIIYDYDKPINKPLLNMLYGSLKDAEHIVSQDEAYEYVANIINYIGYPKELQMDDKKKYKYIDNLLKNDFLPNLGKSYKKKALFLGHMTKRLINCYIGREAYDDRDNYINKRIDLPGILLGNLFRQYFSKLVKDMRNAIMKEFNSGLWKTNENYVNIINNSNIYKIIKSTTIESGIKYSLATGNWGIKTNSAKNRVGVAQVCNRLNFFGMLSHLRRVNTPTEKTGKLVPPRKLHNTQWGIICPAETPEGSSVGLVKNLALGCHITINTNPEVVYQCLNAINLDKIEDASIETIKRSGKIFINGDWCFITPNVRDTYNYLIDLRRRAIINIFTSIIWYRNTSEIYVYTSEGRQTRPLYIVNNNKLKITLNDIQYLKNKKYKWKNLLFKSLHLDGPSPKNIKNNISKGVIEYVDVEESSTQLIAMNNEELTKSYNNNIKWKQGKKINEYIKNYSHCEIHPSLILGVLTSCSPFPDHNQSPRNCYQCAMGKQAMGIYSTNYNERLDTLAHILHYPNKPMVNTRITEYFNANKIPSGMNAIVAICSHSGYNQEDSVIMNKGSIDRGLFRSTFSRTYKIEEKKIQSSGDEERFQKPDPGITKDMKPGSYDKLNKDGFVSENTFVKNADIIAGKIMPIKNTNNDKYIYKDSSTSIRSNESGFIDNNYKSINQDGNKFCKIKIRSERIPQIGDKFSSRHGQKGTIGMVFKQADMPYTHNGMTPDIIINPHAIPSRMTIGQLLECILGKTCATLGYLGDGSPFNIDNKRRKIDKIGDILEKYCGFERYGNEIMYNGRTGRQMKTSIFIGPTFYQRLKHMVDDKIHSRASGPVVMLTRQPAEGRSRDGGLRFGEMERDCYSGDTLISLRNGLSVTIKSMKDCDNNVLGWNKHLNGMVEAKQSNWMFKGERECVELIMEDGRKNICTPDHPVLTSDNEWIKAKDLVIGKTKIKASVSYPPMNIDEEIKECNGWTLQVGKLKLYTHNKNEYLKTLAFARMIGILITDGNIYCNMKTNTPRMCVYLGHLLDVEGFIYDLKLFCDTKQKNYTHKNLYYVQIPTILAKNIIQLPGILKGRRVNQPGTLPNFITDPSCPRPIVREFLGGLFGGDGHTCVLGKHRGKRDILTSISFSQTKNYKHLDSLKLMMKQIETLLNKCGIYKITIQKCKETTHSKNKYIKCANKDYTDERSWQMNLHLDINELIPFSEKIGFRYCCHKTQRLEAGVSYKRLRNEVVRQHNWLVNRVDELTNFTKIKAANPNKKVRTKKAILKAIEELKENEPLIHNYAIPTSHDITDHLIKGTKFGKFRSKSFPTAEQFLRKIGALDWFIDDIDNSHYGVERNAKSLPTMNLTVIERRPVGLKDVYDIQVDKEHSFLANGVVAHNCMISHGLSQFLKERMLDVSDHYKTYTCNSCGFIAAVNTRKGIYCCKKCNNYSNFSEVHIPYTFKLLVQELESMGLAPRICT
tara:strand:- start:2160 stop:7364 length:5205 start_codon:yes stop_codon:yes gene_type:complete